jgi:DNA-binding NtrC family response regulator
MTTSKPGQEVTLHQRTRMLIAVSDSSLLERLDAVAPQWSIDVRVARTGAIAQELVRDAAPHVVMIDHALSDMTAIDLLKAMRARVPQAPVIVLAAGAGVPEAVRTMRAGAFAFLERPFDAETLRQTVAAACQEHGAGHQRVRSLAQSATPRATDVFAAIIGRAPSLRALLDTVKLVAPSDANCLIVGENGTGKELIADMLHASSARAGGPFVKINCAAIPEGLLESELFGHKKGAFTGAVADQEGLFQRANGGSLFLDEIAEMPRALQAKLLRVLQEREFQPVGGARSVALDVRLISATNVDVERAVREQRLREDLLFRINTITLKAPPLRERLDDLPALCTHFLQKFSQRYERPVRGVTAAAMEALSRYEWPGNVRELENILERAVLLSATDEIDVPALPAEMLVRPDRRGAPAPALLTLEQVERRALLEALERANWNKQRAAATLGIYRPTLYSKMRKYAIRDPNVARGRAGEL